MLTIRPARPEDLPSIQLLAGHLAEHVEESGPPVLQAAEIDAMFFAGNAPMSCAVAEENGVIVGLVTWMSYFILHTARREVYIGDLAVHRDHRGRKIGRRLFNHVVTWAHDQHASKLTWEVWEHNHTAQAFYARQGGEPLTDEIHYRIDL